jgi:hypothetical protein
LIARVVGPVVAEERRYPQPLPSELAPWYVYTNDGGHSIVVAVASLFTADGDPEEFLVPAPVRAVQRAGWREQGGYLVCNLPFNEHVGLLTDSDDDES